MTKKELEDLRKFSTEAAQFILTVEKDATCKLYKKATDILYGDLVTIFFDTNLFAQFLEQYICFLEKNLPNKAASTYISINGNEPTSTMKRHINRILKRDSINCSLKTVDHILTFAEIPLPVYEEYELACS